MKNTFWPAATVNGSGTAAGELGGVVPSPRMVAARRYGPLKKFFDGFCGAETKTSNAPPSSFAHASELSKAKLTTEFLALKTALEDALDALNVSYT